MNKHVVVHNRIVNTIVPLCMSNNRVFIMTGDLALLYVHNVVTVVSSATLDIPNDTGLLDTEVLQRLCAWSLELHFTIKLVSRAARVSQFEISFDDGISFQLSLNFLTEPAKLTTTLHKNGVWAYTLSELLVDKLIEYRLTNKRQVAYDIVNIAINMDVDDYTMFLIANTFADKQKVLEDMRTSPCIPDTPILEEVFIKKLERLYDKLRTNGIIIKE